MFVLLYACLLGRFTIFICSRQHFHWDIKCWEINILKLLQEQKIRGHFAKRTPAQKTNVSRIAWVGEISTHFLLHSWDRKGRSISLIGHRHLVFMQEVRWCCILKKQSQSKAKGELYFAFFFPFPTEAHTDLSFTPSSYQTAARNKRSCPVNALSHLSCKCPKVMDSPDETMLVLGDLPSTET